MDLRMIKTRRDIRNALLDLLDDNRSFESITGSQIARRANISRSTFYDHYSDKYALLNALFDEVREQLTRITEAYFSEEGGTSYRLELANEILAYVLENARLFRLLLSGAVSLQRVGQLLDETLIPPCMAYLKQHPNKYGLDDAFVSQIYSSIIFICLQWIASHQNPEDLSKILALSAQVGQIFNS